MKPYALAKRPFGSRESSTPICGTEHIAGETLRRRVFCSQGFRTAEEMPQRPFRLLPREIEIVG
jgi:hypothetical protein